MVKYIYFCKLSLYNYYKYVLAATHTHTHTIATVVHEALQHTHTIATVVPEAQQHTHTIATVVHKAQQYTITTVVHEGRLYTKSCCHISPPLCLIAFVAITHENYFNYGAHITHIN